MKLEIREDAGDGKHDLLKQIEIQTKDVVRLYLWGWFVVTSIIFASTVALITIISLFVAFI